jgi:subtilisin family serine protease
MNKNCILIGIALASASTAYSDDCVWQGNNCFTNNLIYATTETKNNVLHEFPSSQYLFSSSAEDPNETNNLDSVDSAENNQGETPLNWFREPVRESSQPLELATQNDKPWDIAYKSLLTEKYPLAATPLVVEPEIVYRNRKFEERKKKLEEMDLPSLSSEVSTDQAQLNTGGPITVNVVKQSEEVWPTGDPGWHLGKDYTNLQAVILEVGDPGDEKRVTIAHLDTGYDKNDKLLPEHFDHGAPRDFTGKDSNKRYEGETGKKPLHGARTLSTLAGRNVRVVAEDGEKLYSGSLGGNPYARIIEYKIGAGVVHFTPGEMAAAISRAVEEGADVISISAGGLPSIAQRNAINKAYSSGTAIFAATGDFFVLPVPFINYTLTPSTVGFPARYSRAMGVAGVTAAGKSYGKAPCSFCLFKFWRWHKILLPWTLRGNYGPSVVMKKNVISAYAPNILHSWPSEKDGSAVALSGSGTSHPTPQVAAAASLWLQYNREYLEGKEAWNDWRKAEAVYQALIKSVDRPEKYTLKHMGEGVLNARQLLDVKITDPSILQKREPAIIGVRWILDLVKSWDLAKLFLDSPLASDSPLKSSLTEMLVTEVKQVIFESKSGQRLIDDHLRCEGWNITLPEKEKCQENVETRFEKILSRSDISSEFLKAAIKDSLDEWLAMNK